MSSPRPLERAVLRHQGRLEDEVDVEGQQKNVPRDKQMTRGRNWSIYLLPSLSSRMTNVLLFTTNLINPNTLTVGLSQDGNLLPGIGESRPKDSKRLPIPSMNESILENTETQPPQRNIEPDSQYDGSDKRHTAQVHRLRETLQPLFESENSDQCVVLLCYGKPSNCHILPARVPSSEIYDSVNTWKIIKHAWNQRPKVLKDYIPFYGVKSVSVASVHGELNLLHIEELLTIAEYLVLYPVSTNQLLNREQ